MFSEALRLLGYGLCHQLAERSFAAGGVQLPVCARDTGIYVGFVVSLVVLQVLGRSRRSEPPSVPVIVLGGLFVGVMAIDGVSSYAGLRETTNAIRLITGLMTGFSLALFATPIVNGQYWVDPSQDRVLVVGRELAWWLLALPASFVIVYWGAPLVGIVYPVAVAIFIVVTFWWVNLAIVCMMPPFERRGRRLLDVWPAHVLALGLTVVELGGGSAFRYALERLVA